MEFWTSAEMAAPMGDRIRRAHNALDAKLIDCLMQVDAGEWRKWRVVYIILPAYMRQYYRETRRLTRRDMTLDFRVAVDFDRALAADFSSQIDLLAEALEKTLPYFAKAKIPPETREQIRQCVRHAAAEAKAAEAPSGK